MVWRSTKNSVLADQISILALVETIAAMGTAFGIYQYSGTLKYIAISGILAPFLLLRTPAMTAQSINWLLRIQDSLLNFASKRSFIVSVFIVLIPTLTMLAVGHLFVKFAITVLNLVLHPLELLRALPGNWRRVVLCTDLFAMPELFPGIEETGDSSIEIFKVSWWIKGLEEDYAIVRYAIGGPSVAVLYAFAGLYRWSLKSTALIWSPLLWAFRPLKAADHLVPFARGILYLTPYRVARWYSGIVIGLFVGKMAIFVLWYQVSAWFESWPAWPLLNHYLASDQLPLWQVASFASAVISFWVFVRAETVVHQADNKIFTEEGKERRFFQITFWIRNLLSAYTSICVLYITVRLAEVVRLPPLHPLVFPWS
jgi:hypothetical protein